MINTSLTLQFIQAVVLTAMNVYVNTEAILARSKETGRLLIHLTGSKPETWERQIQEIVVL